MTLDAVYLAGHGQKVNLSQVFAGQTVGVTQAGERIWLVTVMQYDLGYFDDETCRLGTEVWEGRRMESIAEGSRGCRRALRPGRIPQPVAVTNPVGRGAQALVCKEARARFVIVASDLVRRPAVPLKEAGTGLVLSRRSICSISAPMSAMRRYCLPLLLVALPGSLASQTTADGILAIGQNAACEAYSASAAVFTGVAGARIRKSIQPDDQPRFELPVTPVAVDHAYVGATAPVMYVTPAGIPAYAEPGRRYLFYGRAYGAPDVVMASPGFGAIPIEEAGGDLRFLDALSPDGGGGVVMGRVNERKGPIGLRGLNATRKPLAGVVVRVFNAASSVETITGPDGAFAVAGLPPGEYRVVPGTPEGLAVAALAGHVATVRDGGCADVSIDLVVNGVIRGVLRGPDGQPLPSTSIDVMPADALPDGAGHVPGTATVSTDDRGGFEFNRLRPGAYYVGVGLYRAPNPNGPSYPRTYYPGTSDRSAALPIAVGRARVVEGLDFSIPRSLEKGELEVIVESERPGNVEVCITEVTDGPQTSSRRSVRSGVPQVFPVVDGQRYSVHAHLETSSGHLESEPLIIVGDPQRTVIRLRPDAPRTLH